METIKKGPRVRHYNALKAAADAVGWPERFRTDLTKHDRIALLSRAESRPFVWCLRTDGTALIPPEARPHGEGRDWPDASRMVRWTESAFGAERCRWYLWDGYALQAITADAAVEWLRDHANDPILVTEGPFCACHAPEPDDRGWCWRCNEPVQGKAIDRPEETRGGKKIGVLC